MHIHSGNLNPNASLQGSHRAQAALAARRADDTRKKLSSSADEIDALSSADSAWMISAWGPNSHPNSNSQDSTQAFTEPPSAQRSPQSASSVFNEEPGKASAGKEVKAMPGAVSYWA